VDIKWELHIFTIESCLAIAMINQGFQLKPDRLMMVNAKHQKNIETDLIMLNNITGIKYKFDLPPIQMQQTSETPLNFYTLIVKSVLVQKRR
jgi:hypothetical protein